MTHQMHRCVQKAVAPLATAVLLTAFPAAATASQHRSHRARRPRPPTRLWYRIRLDAKSVYDLFSPGLQGPWTTNMRGTSRHAVIVEKLADGTFETGAGVEGSLIGGKDWTLHMPSLLQCNDAHETYTTTMPGRFEGGVSLRLNRRISRSEAMFNLEMTRPIRGIEARTETDCTYPDGTTVVSAPAEEQPNFPNAGFLVCFQYNLVSEQFSGSVAFGRSFEIEDTCLSKWGSEDVHGSLTVEYHMHFDICPRGGRDVAGCK